MVQRGGGGILQQLLHDAAAPAGSYWIALQQAAGEFGWTTGEPLVYTNWLAGQPDDSGGSDYRSFSLRGGSSINMRDDSGGSDGWGHASRSSSCRDSRYVSRLRDTVVLRQRDALGVVRGEALEHEADLRAGIDDIHPAVLLDDRGAGCRVRANVVWATLDRRVVEQRRGLEDGDATSRVAAVVSRERTPLRCPQ